MSRLGRIVDDHCQMLERVHSRAAYEEQAHALRNAVQSFAEGLTPPSVLAGGIRLATRPRLERGKEALEAECKRLERVPQFKPVLRKR